MKWKGLYESSSVPKQFSYLLLFMIFSYAICSIIGMLGYSFLEDSVINDLQSPNTISCLKWVQGWSSIGIFLIPALLFFYFMNIPFGNVKFNRQQLLLAIACMFLAVPIINYLVVWNESLHLPSFLKDLEFWMRAMEEKAALMTDAFLKMNSLMDLLVNLFLIALIPALGEEFLFRGVIQSSLYRWKGNIHISIWMSAFLFSVLHMQFLGFFPRLLIGGMFGYLFFWSGSIWIPVVVHFINNAFAVSLTYFISKNQVFSDLETLGSEFQGAMLLFCVIGLFILLYLFKIISNKEE